MKRILLLLATVALAACSAAQSPQDKLTVNDKKIDKLIAQMTLEEKVNMLHSKTNMSSAGVERLGIADMNYADGPFGPLPCLTDVFCEVLILLQQPNQGCSRRNYFYVVFSVLIIPLIIG